MKKLALTLLGLDILWALLVATFGGTLFTAIGLQAGSSSLAAHTTGFAAWLMLFIGGLFQGAVFIVVGSVFSAIALFVYLKLPPAGRHVAHVLIVADLVWGAIAATFGSSVFYQISSNAGLHSGTTAFASIALWLIGFVGGVVQGAVFIFVLSVMALAVLFLIAVAKNSKKS